MPWTYTLSSVYASYTALRTNNILWLDPNELKSFETVINKKLINKINVNLQYELHSGTLLTISSGYIDCGSSVIKSSATIAGTSAWSMFIVCEVPSYYTGVGHIDIDHLVYTFYSGTTGYLISITPHATNDLNICLYAIHSPLTLIRKVNIQTPQKICIYADSNSVLCVNGLYSDLFLNGTSLATHMITTTEYIGCDGLIIYELMKYSDCKTIAQITGLMTYSNTKYGTTAIASLTSYLWNLDTITHTDNTAINTVYSSDLT